MSSPLRSSPHMIGPHDTAWVMWQVLAALIPGLAALTWFFGWGHLVNAAIAMLVALAAETAALKLRKLPTLPNLRDSSVLVTAVLLGAALPPYCPWWVTVSGTAFAVLIGKHAYGGIGYNPFNPAMVGYVVLLISFPVEMTQWVAPRGLGASPPGLWQTVALIFGGGATDGMTMATPLDLFKQGGGQQVAELWAATPQFGRWGGRGWEWINLMFAGGGLYLLWRGIFPWHAPVGMLAALVVLSALFYRSGGADSLGSPLMHLCTGATMMGAFFIVTDPVSGSTSNRGRLYFGIGVGSLVFVLRSFSNYPDGVAFAVLLMNFSAPLIDHYVQPRSYGHPPR